MSGLRNLRGERIMFEFVIWIMVLIIVELLIIRWDKTLDIHDPSALAASALFAAAWFVCGVIRIIYVLAVNLT